MSDEEPCKKKFRSEGLKTICVRCSSLHNEFQFTNWLLWDHREELGITDWFEIPSVGVEGVATKAVPKLKATAPIDFIFVPFSRKPYFLVEGPPEFLDKMFDVFGPKTNEAGAGELFQFKSSPLSIMLSTGATVSSQREKVESVITAKSQATKETTPQPTEEKPKPAPKMIPRAVRLTRK